MTDMKQSLSPKKSARIAANGRIKVYSPKSNNTLSGAFYIKPTGLKIVREFKFEIITPLMQIEERNNKYQFFQL